MQAAHSSFHQLNLRSDSATVTPLTVHDDEIEPETELAQASEVPSQRADLTQRVAAALSASARAEANVRALFRTVKFLGASLGSARETNEQLLSELTALHSALANGSEAAPPQHRPSTSLLEQALLEAHEQAVQEREFLIAEQDAFIASLIGDYEQEIQNLRRRVAEAESKLAAREAEDFGRGWAGD